MKKGLYFYVKVECIRKNNKDFLHLRSLYLNFIANDLHNLKSNEYKTWHVIEQQKKLCTIDISSL